MGGERLEPLLVAFITEPVWPGRGSRAANTVGTRKIFDAGVSGCCQHFDIAAFIFFAFVRVRSGCPPLVSNRLLLPQGVAGGFENHLLLRLSPPPLLPHINAHALIHTLHTSYLPLPLPPPHDLPYFCALMNSLSIKKKKNRLLTA